MLFSSPILCRWRGVLTDSPPPPPPPLPPAKPQPKPQTIVPTRMLTPATLSDLDGIDMMDLPVDLEETEMTFSPEDIKPELMQETHACFFSLVRDIICSTPDHRMSLSTLEDRVRAWAVSPISPLNDWYSATVADTTGFLHSAIAFLSGDYADWQPEEFVPYIEYKSAIASYQWIGAGRDTDNHLIVLCKHWMDRRDDMVTRPIKEEEGLTADQLTASPPPPRCPTAWLVQLSTPEEKDVFREQERVRYENPHKAFTFRMHGYESVVGPVKGMYYQSVGNSKPRGHLLLNEIRPNFVTILALVRDATARLPNGEGTRADICTLLRDSQYLIETAPDSDLNSVVSGALDRLHYEPDPCVKYDTKRKTWIYLHRARTEQEFERIHQEQQKAVKPKNPRKAHRAKVLATAPGDVKPEPTPKPPSKRASKASTKPSKAAAAKATAAASQQSSWVQLQTVDNNQLLPDISSVEVKTEPVEKIIATVASTPAPAVSQPLVVQQRLVSQGVQKSLITSNLVPSKTATKPPSTAKTTSTVKTIPAVKTDHVDAGKSILGKSNRQKGPVGSKAAKNVKNVKDPAVSAVRRIVDTPVSVSAGSAIRRIPDNPVPPVMQSIVRRTPDTSRGKKETLLLDPSVSAAMQAKKKGVSTTTAAQMVDMAGKSAGKSLVKMITTQAGVRTIQSPAQMNAQQVMLIKQGQQTFISEPQPTASTKSPQQQTPIQGQQLIVMKPGDPQASSSQAQMIVINQQQIVTDQQLTAKQQKQLQHILSRHQFTEQQPAMSLQQQQQQQIQQIIMAKQQQILAEQQKSGKLQQQQMIVLKQQQGAVAQQAQEQPKSQQLQQMILVKQQQQQQLQQQQHQQHVIASETQQITQQQLQLFLKQQQQQLQQSQQIQAATTLASMTQQAKGQVQTTISLAQFQQLQQQQQQQQQQQRIVTSASLLTQPRVVNQVGSQPMTTQVQVQTSNLLKSQPMLAKVMTNAQGQPLISMESLLSHQKQLPTMSQALRVAATSNKPGAPPQYTVVSVAQPRVIQASQLTQASPTPVVTASASVAATVGSKLTTPTTATAANLRMGGINLAHIGGKPVLLASKPQSLQPQNLLVASQGAGQTVLLASPQGIGSQTLRAQSQLTVLQQGNQQILLPPGFTTSALNLKALQGLKVIPITPSPAGKGVPGRPTQVFARFINPSNIRPVVANLVQTDQPSTSNPSTTSE